MHLQSPCNGLQVRLRIPGVRILDLRNSGRREPYGVPEPGLAHFPVFAPFLNECALQQI